MSSVKGYTIGDLVKLELVYKQDDIGIAGLSCSVAIRDTLNNYYLDWFDNVFKSSGWGQKYRSLNDLGSGIYQVGWDSSLSITDRKVLIAEYVCTSSGYEAQAFDTLVFGITEMVESNRWKIENNQMIFYSTDGITPIMRFNLYDASGQPTMDDVMERRRV